MKQYLKFLFVIIQFQSIFMDIEYMNSIHHNLNLDPSVLKKLSAIEEKKESKLCKADPESVWIYAEKHIDTNHDEKIDMTEFRDTITRQLKKTQRKELETLYKILDPKDTGVITFETYISDALGDTYDMDEVKKDRETVDPYDDLNEIRIFYETEKKKWYFISKNRDDMNREQFSSFIFSDDHQDIKDFENTLVFKIYDKNNDAFWSFDEYMFTSKQYDDSIVNIKKKKFLPIADLNEDNKLSFDEFNTWQNKFGKEHLYTEEQDFVFIPCDSDKDSLLNRTEVITCCDKFMKSHLTDFGDELGSDSHVKDEL